MTELNINPSWLSAAADLSSVVVAIVALALSWVALRASRHRDILSVKPLPFLAFGDYDDRLSVKLWNHGTGPMVVKRLKVTCGEEVHAAVIDLVHDAAPGIVWSEFVPDIADRSIPLGGHIDILMLDQEAGTPDFERARDLVRARLAGAVVTISYTDNYGSSFDDYQRDLTWFRRHLDT